MVNAILWEVLVQSTKCEGNIPPPTSWKVEVVLLGIIFLNTELNKPHFLRDEMFFYALFATNKAKYTQ